MPVAAKSGPLATCLWSCLTAVLIVGSTTSVESGAVFDQRPSGSRWSRYAVAEDSLYLSPIRLLVTPDGETLYVTCEGTHELLVVDAVARRVVDRVPVGRLPFEMALSPDGSRLYVGNREDNTVTVVEVPSHRVVATFPVGEDPHGMAADREGRHLFVANLGTNDLRVYDTESFREVKRLEAGQAPFDVALSPDGGTLYVSNQYSNPVLFRTPPVLELTVLDVEEQLVSERRNLYSTVVAQGVAVSPDGRFVATALEFPKNLIPQTQVYQGWMVAYGIALTETRPGGRTAYLLIDEPNLYFADPYGIAFSPDGRTLYITSSGADAITAVDMDRALRVLDAEDGRIGITDVEVRRLARHLGISSEYVAGRIPTGINPKDVAVSPDGHYLYVADRLSDRITVADAHTLRPMAVVDLGGPEKITQLRKGARLFNYASISFHKQMSCNTCHPENHVDGLVYDIAADGGMGRNLVDNLTLRGIAETAPFKWTGKNPTLQRQEGPRAAQLFFRTHGFDGDENEAIVRFIESIPLRPNRYRETGAVLDPFQLLGKAMFERAYDNAGQYIPVSNRCVTCHPAPYGTDRVRHDVGSRNDHDWGGVFDTPHLTNVYQRPPYMHDGRCYSLEEIWTRFNPYDTHGVTNDMRKDQLNALIEFIKTF